MTFENRVLLGSADDLSEIPDESINCCVTSPPYFGLRDYKIEGQIGLEPSLEAYVARLVAVFREVRRVLRQDGTLWLNLGDSYASAWACNRGDRPGMGEDAPTLDQRVNKRAGGFKEKDQMLVPHAVAMALRADGWWLRDTIVWHKPNPMPSSVTDRTTPSHEYVFLLTKRARYYYNQDAIREPLAESSVQRLSQDVENQEGSTRANAGGKTNGNMKAVRFGGTKGNDDNRTYSGKTWEARKAARAPLRHGLTGVTETQVGKASGDDGFIGANARSVWSIATEGYSAAHFATMPRELARRCILAGCPPGGSVLDIFAGTGTTGEVAIGCGMQYVLKELNPEYHKLIQDRLGLFGVA